MGIQTSQPHQPEGLPAFDSLGSSLISSPGLILLGIVGLLGLLYAFDGLQNGKQPLASARFGGKQEKRTARCKAMAQMQARQHNQVALYIGTPQDASDPRPLYLPDVQRGVAVIGGPGSGKTYSVIDPLIRSALEQGFPVIQYDFKYPTQTARHAAYAAHLGYEVHVFAPGFPESAVCNPLDFLRDDSDVGTARQFAEVMNKNFRLLSQAGDDRFFDAAGDQLTEAVLALAKSTAYPDIMMAQAFLALTNLGERVAAAREMNPWVRKSFDQLVSVKDSEKTQAGIIGSASEVFSRFMKPDVLGAFCGNTTLPLDLEGRTLLIFGMDRERRDVIGPLVAGILHTIISRNVSRKRRDPLVVAIDELPTLYLPALVQWINENREDGLALILGFQNLAQLEKGYSREVARAILGACATKAIFNPQEQDSAHLFSQYLGQEEIQNQRRSRSRGKGGTSVSTSEDRQTRPLLESSQFLKLKTGQCVLINPNFSNRQEAYLPLRQHLHIPKTDLHKAERSQSLWEKVQSRLAARSPKEPPSVADLEQRTEVAEALLPEPAEPAQSDEFDQISNRLKAML